MIGEYLCNGNKIYVIHTPGDNDKQFKTISRGLINDKVRVHDCIALVTVATKDILDRCVLKEQCEASGVVLHNAASEHDPNTLDWTNPMKIFYIVNALKTVVGQKKYSLILDGSDTVLTADIDGELIAGFEALRCDMLFNGSPKAFPVCMEDMEDILIRKGNHKFLNAGVVFGRTEKLLEFYTDLWEEVSCRNFPNFRSEQRVLTARLVEKNPRVKKYSYVVDSESKFFAVLHKDDNVIISDDRTGGKTIIYKW